MSTGISVWSVILTIIALFFAGRITSHLAGIGNARDGVTHGMVMFGLSMASALVIIALAGTTLGAGAGIPGPHSAFILDLFATL